ncbi:MAG: hypothetical protein U0930_02215 [Pirellulales bacterium]
MNHSSPNWHTAGYVGSRQEARAEVTHSHRQTLWIDGVGGYLMLDRDDILVGQAGGLVDIGIVGDISRQAAVIRRRQSDYFVEPLQYTRVDDREISEASLLTSDCLLQFGSRVKTRLVKPHPLSSTARLEMVSLHRFQPRVDGVLLLADSCILGPTVSSHVRCPQWSQDLLMFRQGSQWFFRTVSEIEVDGKMRTGQVAIESGMRVRGSDFSLSIE